MSHIVRDALAGEALSVIMAIGTAYYGRGIAKEPLEHVEACLSSGLRRIGVEQHADGIANKAVDVGMLYLGELTSLGAQLALRNCEDIEEKHHNLDAKDNLQVTLGVVSGLLGGIATISTANAFCGEQLEQIKESITHVTKDSLLSDLIVTSCLQSIGSAAANIGFQTLFEKAQSPSPDKITDKTANMSFTEKITQEQHHLQQKDTDLTL